ncbi:MAG: TIM barrel protein [Candidatus Nanoarchaeia archaeon]
MIIGIKTRWLELNSDEINKLSNHVELHLELNDIYELFDKQVVFLKRFNKTFHLHAPFKDDGGDFLDFIDDFKVFEQCVRLGDKINKGFYHLVCHAPKSTDLVLLKKLVSKLLHQSSKVIICFENLCGPEAITFNSVKSFTNLFRSVTNKRVGMCLDLCHAYIVGPIFFDLIMTKIPERVLHVHFADTGANGEHGFQMGKGIIDFKHVMSRLPDKAVLIPEITNGHLNHNKGLIIAYNKIKRLLQSKTSELRTSI